MIYIEPICLSCLNYLGPDRQCKAFPIQIPEDVWMGNQDHEQVIEGQQGSFLYSPNDDPRPSLANMEQGII